MPELVRSVVSRFQIYFKDRRQTPRLRVRLLFTVAIHRAQGSGALRRRQTLQGHTRDLSVNGLAMLVPQVNLEGHHLAAGGRELQVQLEMGSGAPIPMLVVPRRYERLDEAELGCSYLIGARIVSIGESDRIRYQNFINERLQDAA